ncbi:ABC transporter permease [Anaerocolumna aminovalerica]|mgnify:CR=1 FL=1|uniref:Nucleoside ABC transporter membrane protein n=1 Tax=Anaerocolumna aminovalerica TaxID=1527 RepID=A0A1I5DNE4_9FIRM|nr:ABC transporter permease [Anaerocolumna aminovalerica]MBU5332935.1 ABC transporter permease [Anaerocolumna aminovalerica]SFO00754.1 nucleoside ABC transporter membrane protein [Anaerocolumna aminovalerica]
MKKKHNLLQSKGTSSFFSVIMAIVAGLLFGFVILLISNYKNAFPALITIIKGGFTNGTSGLGQVLYMATPIIMTGLSVGFAFKTGLFNIGASGQFTTGAFVAVYIGIKWTFLPSGIHWIVALLGAIIAGALWGMVPGILKALANVNEVITSIMMNYIGIYLVNMLIVKSIYDPLKNQTESVPKSAIIPRGGLEQLFDVKNMNIGIFIAIFAVILIYIVLSKTTFGYELKACGHSPSASQYAGINDKRNIILSMVIAGALAGLGGGLLYLSGSGKYMQVIDILAPEGFNGISVALLGMSNPIGILFAGLFIAHIKVGGNNIQLYNYSAEIIDIIIAVIIYCGAFSLLFKNLIHKLTRRNKLEKEEGR